eukprot:7387267-Prymnesium_polylepis.4
MPCSGWSGTRPKHMRASGRRTDSASTYSNVSRKALKILVEGARHHQEGEAKCQWQHPPQPGCERYPEPRCESLIVPLTATLHHFGTGPGTPSSRPRCVCGSRPDRRLARQRCAQTWTAARGRGSIGWGAPGREAGRLNVVDARHRGDAL